MNSAQQVAHILRQRKPNLMDATGHHAVLVPLVEVDGVLHLLYEVRAASLRRQPNEVCFPGGRMEEGECPTHTALRETAEELGITEEHITVLGELDFVAHRARFVIYPVLALLDADALRQMRPSADEVERTILVPVSALMEQGERSYHCRLVPQLDDDFPYDALGIPVDYQWTAGMEDFPVYHAEGCAIWGLTGRMTRHALHLLEGRK